jgi:Tfp pilus assembly protein PilN
VFFLEYSRIVKNQHGQKKKELQDRIQVADAEIARLTPFKRELESYEGQKKMVEARLGAVRQLLAQRATPVFVLDSIAQSLPNRVWLTGIEFSLEGTIQLAGAALSNDDISDYMDRLSESVHLSDVTLIDVAATRDNRTDLKTFSISARPKSQT